MLVGSYYNDLKSQEQENVRNQLLRAFQEGKNVQPDIAQASQIGVLSPFHWQLEFPEAFLREKSGFDAFIGNPPFIGGKRISIELGAEANRALKTFYDESKGAADYVVYFIRRAFKECRDSGYLGFIATSSIAEADTREVGLEYIIKHGGKIIRAERLIQWPGSAGVYVSIVHIVKGDYEGKIFIGNSSVKNITANLDDLPEKKPHRLKKFYDYYAQGPTLNGKGFIISADEFENLICINTKYKEVLYPYLNGQMLNNISSFHNPSAYVINFRDWEKEKAQSYEDVFKIVQERVKPKRDKLTGQIHEHRFWLHWDRREDFFRKFSQNTFFLASSRTTKYLSFSLVPNNWYCSGAIKLFGFESFDFFAILQSTIHEIWARRYSSKLKTDLRYSTSDAFDTFPFPNPKQMQNIQEVGKKFYEYRSYVMLDLEIGLTKTYNQFHDQHNQTSIITSLRELHIELDKAILNAYCWNDIDLSYDFFETTEGIRFTVIEGSRREIINRLIELNHAYYEEEVRQGFHGKKALKEFSKKIKGTEWTSDEQLALF